MTELLPCPLCKKPPGSRVGPPQMVRCINSECDGPSLAARSVDDWNVYALPAAPAQGVSYRRVVEECARLVEMHATEMRMAETTMTARGVSSIAAGLLSRFDHDGFGLPAAAPESHAALREAFEAGALAVHREWLAAHDRGEGPPRGDPEFGEAASDYASSHCGQKCFAEIIPIEHPHRPETAAQERQYLKQQIARFGPSVLVGTMTTYAMTAPSEGSYAGSLWAIAEWISAQTTNLSPGGVETKEGE